MSTSPSSKIRVMLVDDSAVVRRFLGDMLRERGFEIMAAVQDPIFAMEVLKKDTPDVIILDVEMPRMDGLTFLRHIMSTNPLPVVMCSTLTSKGADVTLQALEIGAVGIITKPTQGLKEFLQREDNGLVQAVRSAHRCNMRLVRAKPHAAPTHAANTPAAGTSAPSGGASMFGTTHKIVVIGASTGGVQAIEHVLPKMPKNAPGMVLVQHMPEKFTGAFSQRLNNICQIEVREAKNGDRILPGVCLIAPGGKHTRVVRSGAQFGVEVFDGPTVSHHRPSVDVLFRSAASTAGKNAIGVILTGMGDDGARGMRDMYEAGIHTIAQNEATCVVFGMPKEAIRLGGVREILPLDDITQSILSHCLA